MDLGPGLQVALIVVLVINTTAMILYTVSFLKLSWEVEKIKDELKRG